MAPIHRFDPFNDRTCRDVRNALSEAFGQALAQHRRDPAERVAGRILKENLPEVVRVFVRDRLAAYGQVLDELAGQRIEEPLHRALVILGRGLFFEAHELLEPVWMAATGDEKRFVQALIRVAGVHVHLEQGNCKAARRMADKALAVLEKQPHRLAACGANDHWLERLRRLDPRPPTIRPAPVRPASRGRPTGADGCE